MPAYAMCHKLAVEEGLFCGTRSGAAVWAAVKIALDFTPADTVVALLPHRGDRTVSTSLFRLVCAECPP